ncbi:MAG: hypothetical protein RLZZ142_2498, partial [Verrucomicrobiota bacterium]
IEDAVRLRVGGVGREEVERRVDSILEEVGMEAIAEKRVEVLSGGQRRRLALGMELVSAPRLLLCDEVTSGLDPRAEDELTLLLRQVASRGRVVLNITHSLKHLALHDSVIVLSAGRLVYHADPKHLLHYFGIGHQEELYPRLAERAPEDWAHSWQKHKSAYYGAGPAGGGKSEEWGEGEGGLPASAWKQGLVLWRRRWRLFFRDAGQVKLQIALLLGFPALVVIFALKGLPSLRAAAEISDNAVQQMLSDFATRLDYLRVGGLVSGLIMFQVVLLTLMGSNNGAREISGERLILEKEKFSGLSPLAYVASKVGFLGVLVAVQSIWMGLFVNSVIRMPGDLVWQNGFLFLVNAAMTAVTLGISSLARTPEQSSLISVYLVGFQLPLSGAVLALPDWLGQLTRPFIASYWGWSGFLQTLQETRFYKAVTDMTQTPMMPPMTVLWVLGCHVILGLTVAYLGSRGSRWE